MKEKMTEFGNIVAKAVQPDINAYVWKRKSGEEVRLMDMSDTELNKVYKHVHEMLYNENKYVPGKHQVKLNLTHLIQDCNAELFKRYLIYECKISGLDAAINIVNYLRDFKKQHNLSDSEYITSLFEHLPQEFTGVTFDELIAACLDQLSVINRKMISQQFILSKGVWLTEQEKAELTEMDEVGKRRPWMEVAKERLFLPDNIKLRINPNGFSYSELRALLHLTPLSKISSLSTDTLKLMRNKVLPMLNEDTNWHIKKWEGLKSQVEEVAKYKNVQLTNFDK